MPSFGALTKGQNPASGTFVNKGELDGVAMRTPSVNASLNPPSDSAPPARFSIPFGDGHNSDISAFGPSI